MDLPPEIVGISDMALTVLINEPPYVNDKAWNALRMAQTALASDGAVNIFLMGDAVYAARKGQHSGDDRPSVEALLADLIEEGADVRVCTTCVHSRPSQPEGSYGSCFVGSHSGEKLSPSNLVSGVKMGTMSDVHEWALEGKMICF